MLDALLQALHAGGSISMMVVAVYLWRLDRRVVRLEVATFGPQGMRE